VRTAPEIVGLRLFKRRVFEAVQKVFANPALGGVKQSRPFDFQMDGISSPEETDDFESSLLANSASWLEFACPLDESSLRP